MAAASSSSSEVGGNSSRSKRGRGDTALKWQPKSSGTQANGTAAAASETHSLPNGVKAAAPVPTHPPSPEQPTGHTDDRPGNGSVGAIANEQVATRGGRQKGTGRGGDRAQTNGHGLSARSSSDPAPAHDGDFPGLPSGDAPRTARPAAPRTSSNGLADAPQSSSHLLAQQLKNSEQRKARREGAVLRLRGEIRRLQEEVQDATRQEWRLQAEATSVQEQGKEQADKLRERQAELRKQVKEESKLSTVHEGQHQWLEELESMRWQKDAACEQNAEMERSRGIWKKASAEQLRRLKASEVKLKSLEAIRVEHRSQHKKLEAQAEQILQVKVESLAVGQELRKQLSTSNADVTSLRQQWQAASVVLTIMLFYLLF